MDLCGMRNEASMTTRPGQARGSVSPRVWWVGRCLSEERYLPGAWVRIEVCAARYRRVGRYHPKPRERTGLEGLRGCAGPAAKDDATGGRVAGDWRLKLHV